MHPRLEQCWELGIKGKRMWDLEAEYHAAQVSSEFPKNIAQQEVQKASFHRTVSSPRKAKPPTDPETLRRLLEAEREAEAAMRNASKRFDQDPIPNDTPIRIITNPWLTAQSKGQDSVASGSLQPPTGSRNNQPRRHWSNYRSSHRQPTHQRPAHQQWNHQQPKQQQPKQQQSSPQKPKNQQSNPQQPGNKLRYGQEPERSQPKNNWSATRPNRPPPQDNYPNKRPSDGQSTTPITNNQRHKKQDDTRHQPDGATSPRRRNNLSYSDQVKLGERQPREEWTAASQKRPAQNEGRQPTPNARRPIQLKEESDTEQTPHMSARFPPLTTETNPKTPAGTRADEAPRRQEDHQLPASASLPAENRPFPRSPASPPSPAECSLQRVPQSVNHAPPIPTSAPQPGVEERHAVQEVLEKTSALARTITLEVTGQLHAMHLSMADQFQAHSKNIADQLAKQNERQKKRLVKLKKRAKALANKIETQTEILERQQAWMKRSSGMAKATAANIGKRARPSRATEEWEYIQAPIVGYSDDSTDETYAPSRVLDENDDDEEEEEEDDSAETDSEDELQTESTETDAEEDVLPSVEFGSESEPESVESGSDESGSEAPPPPRRSKRGRAHEATEQRTGPRPAKKRRNNKGKETPVVNPYLELIARDRARPGFFKRDPGKCRCRVHGQGRPARGS
ncbi:hypothetical protein F5144DRAFT_497902 [Chaetomium tenue]|uniref:Uncharacterized protein n=1 Tax=Chaetomium tenue TaxID=1854479 RepID=A0ACB7NZ67_9PEZI|nr:hypothetical protein F5144DRAFT_497902 [Chaetomium globosum]